MDSKLKCVKYVPAFLQQKTSQKGHIVLLTVLWFCYIRLLIFFIYHILGKLCIQYWLQKTQNCANISYVINPPVRSGKEAWTLVWGSNRHCRQLSPNCRRLSPHCRRGSKRSFHGFATKPVCPSEEIHQQNLVKKGMIFFYFLYRYM